VQLTDDVLESDSHASTNLYRAVRENGVLTRGHALGLAISPPLTITVEQLHEIADAVRAGLNELAAVASPA